MHSFCIHPLKIPLLIFFRVLSNFGVAAVVHLFGSAARMDAAFQAIIRQEQRAGLSSVESAYNETLTLTFPAMLIWSEIIFPPLGQNDLRLKTLV